MEKYKHYKNNKLYIIEDTCEIQIDGKWEEAVIYREYGYVQKYCRSKVEFFEKFKLEE
jgi:hypothetical protein